MAPTRGLTEIEQHVIDGVVKILLENLSETWKSIVDVRFRVSSRDTRPQMLQVAAPNEVVLLIGFGAEDNYSDADVTDTLKEIIAQATSAYVNQASTGLTIAVGLPVQKSLTGPGPLCQEFDR